MTSKASLITDADLPLETVDRSKFAELISQVHTYVETGELKSSNGILISEDFVRCQGVALVDRDRGLGALAHLFPKDDPYEFLSGKLRRDGDHIEKPQRIFSDMSRVKAVHVYGFDNHGFP